MGRVREALETAVEAATHLTAADEAALAAARALADKIDAWDVIVDWALDDAADTGGRPAVPQNDNVSLPSFLKYLEALGLTPSSRTQKGESGKGAGHVSKLAVLQAEAARRRGGAA